MGASVKALQFLVREHSALNDNLELRRWVRRRAAVASLDSLTRQLRAWREQTQAKETGQCLHVH